MILISLNVNDLYVTSRFLLFVLKYWIYFVLFLFDLSHYGAYICCNVRNEKVNEM